MASQPTLVVFAGVNGAGKSTFYQSGLWRECDTDSRMSRINPDEMIVAAGKDWSSPTDQLWAGKQAVGQVRDNFAHMRSFNQETTLAGKSAVARIRKAYSLGYRVRLFYIGVNSPEVALTRIRHRVQVGVMIFAPRTSSGVSLRAFPPWVRFCRTRTRRWFLTIPTALFIWLHGRMGRSVGGHPKKRRPIRGSRGLFSARIGGVSFSRGNSLNARSV